MHIWLLHLKFIHPLWKVKVSLPQRGCDFQIEWHIEQFYLKVTHPLCSILVNSTTEGVGISFGSVYRANSVGSQRGAGGSAPTAKN